MKPKHQRLIFICFSLGFLCISTLLALQAFRENVIFFYAPSELATRDLSANEKIRIGGLVEMGSVVHEDENRIRFLVSDGVAHIPVIYKGILPGLFREGQGVVAEGYFKNGTFEAARVLTKHDEYYMPKEVMEVLKKNGRWQGAP